MDLPHGMFVLGLQRQNQMIIPSGETEIYPEDDLLALVPVHLMVEIQTVFKPGSHAVVV
jgi:hypothetical protein